MKVLNSTQPVKSDQFKMFIESWCITHLSKAFRIAKTFQDVPKALQTMLNVELAEAVAAGNLKSVDKMKMHWVPVNIIVFDALVTDVRGQKISARGKITPNLPSKP